MSLEERKRRYLPLNPAEKAYRALYLANPSLYFLETNKSIFRDWNEFCSLYRRTAEKPTALPPNPYTPIGETLLESSFFIHDNIDVEFVLNARYCPPFWHDLNFIKIMYVLNGSFRVNLSRSSSIELHAGQCIIFPPKLEQSVFSFHDEDCVVNIFLRMGTFEKNFSTLLMTEGQLSNFFWNVLYGKDEDSIIWFKSEPDVKMDEYVLDMLEAIERPEQFGNFFLVSYVMAFLSYALCVHRQDMSTVNGTQFGKGKFPDIIRYIRENYASVTLGSLAERFGKSEEYLCRYIKRETGYSFTQMLKRYRIHRAARMLRETENSIEEIMYSVGYTDVSYFYKVFKARYHMTPLTYRRQEHIINL